MEKTGLREGGRRRKEATGFYQWCTLAAKAFWTLVDFCSEYELRCQSRRFLCSGLRLRSSLVIGGVFSEFVQFLARLSTLCRTLDCTKKTGLREGERHLLPEATWFH